MTSYQDNRGPKKEPGRKLNARRRATIRRLGTSLIELDNPDDGELFETGDASDFAGEARHKFSGKPRQR